MSERPSAVFLERQTYRRRRLVDWLRILPLIGLALWMLPLLWSNNDVEPTGTASAIVYIFLVWLGLVMISAASAYFLGVMSRSSTAETSMQSLGEEP